MTTNLFLRRVRTHFLHFPHISRLVNSEYLKVSESRRLLVHRKQYHLLSIYLCRNISCRDIVRIPSLQQKRFLRKSKGKKYYDPDDDTDSDSESLNIDEEEEFPPETDPTIPPHSGEKLVHSVRSDHIFAQCLTKSRKATEDFFYMGRLRVNNKVLLKKGYAVKDNDILDVVYREKEEQLMIVRVKVLKIYKKLTKSKKPIVAVRMWVKPFWIDKKNPVDDVLT